MAKINLFPACGIDKDGFKKLLKAPKNKTAKKPRAYTIPKSNGFNYLGET